MTPTTKSRPTPAQPDAAPTPLDDAKTALTALLTEQAGIAEAIVAAAEEADGVALVRLRRRGDEIGTELWGARVRVARLKIAHLEARRPALDAATKAANEQYEPAKAALDAARAAYNEAENAVYCARQDQMDADQMLVGARRELAALTAEQRPPLAPIVRSLPHAPRSLV